MKIQDTRYKIFSWNIEGFRRNKTNLKYFVDLHLPDFIFLSEPNLFQCDLDQAMLPFKGEYLACLNSEDLYDAELPLIKSVTHGGTMILWKRAYDPHIKVVSVESTAFLPIIFSPPNQPISIHVAIYLPTSGKENEFVEETAQLISCIDQLRSAHPEALFYLRGDFNARDNNIKRLSLLNHLCDELDLGSVAIPHPTYHHFMGDGASDSNLDKIFFSNCAESHEELFTIVCKLVNPLISSHHDLILTNLSLPFVRSVQDDTENVTAPRILNNRIKINWSDSGIEDYAALVSPQLERLQNLWLGSPTRTSVSLLLESTNHILKSTASQTNKTIDLSKPFKPRSNVLSRTIKASQKNLLKESKNLRNINPASEEMINLKNKHLKAKTEHRKLVRLQDMQESFQRDELLHSVLTNPSAIFRSIKNASCSSGSTEKLTVGKRVYLGNKVPDGFFESLSGLKSIDRASLDSSAHFKEFTEDYQNILKICSTGKPIPPISESKSFNILQKMKPNTMDFFSITSQHYINAGSVGIKHFNLLLNALISDVDNLTITEVNIVFAKVLFKGHEKDKTSDRSYRTISICPLIAKALDLYVRELNIEAWNDDQSEVQFQGEGSSHELAALLLSETIQHSLFTSHEPVFLLYLDAKSAFDVVLRELFVKNLYHCGTDEQSILYINNRLENRTTCLEWNREIVGPIRDERGFEQGGANSSDFYKIYGKEQLDTAQVSGLGVFMGKSVISAIGLADDTVLLSNSPHALQNLLHLTLTFCSKYHVQLCVEKTKLQVMSTKPMRFQVDYLKAVSPVNIEGNKLKFVDTAEHVGILRSITGNMPNILSRITGHKKALGTILHTGAARHHRGNPAASLKLDQLKGISVLFSGLGALLLIKTEIDLIDNHHKENIRKLLRLFPGTPRCVTAFLSGSLPGSALLHLRQFSLFGMICRMPHSILHNHAIDVLTVSKRSPKSWFNQIRSLCLTYSLPHPLTLLEVPETKIKFKKMVKKQVIDFWEQKLRETASNLPSLEFFHPQFMSLTTTHPVITTAGSSPYRVNMSTVQCLMMSGRYRSEALCSHWSQSGSKACTAPSCQGLGITEDLSHILAFCGSLNPTRNKLADFTVNFLRKLNHPAASKLIQIFCLPSNPSFCQFLVDCSSIPEVISAFQEFGPEVHQHLFHVTRVWCYCLHRDRLRRLGRWRKF